MSNPETNTKTTIHIQLEPRVTPELLKDLRRRLGQSLTEFGWTLKRAIYPKADQPFSRKYISALEHGRERVTEKIAAAYYEIDGVSKEIPAGIAGAELVKVLAQPGQVIEGALIKRTMQTKACARPGCKVVFIGLGKYHDPECAREWCNARRRQAHRE